MRRNVRSLSWPGGHGQSDIFAANVWQVF